MLCKFIAFLHQLAPLVNVASPGKLYIGQTTDLKRRLIEHNTGNSPATKPNIPYEIVFYSGFKNQQDGINCEKYFKTTAGWKRIKNMLENTLKE